MIGEEFLRDIAFHWKRRIERCKDHKQRVFGEVAEKAWRFLTASYADLYFAVAGDGQSVSVIQTSGPYYKPRINKCLEFVDLYMPYVLARNPYRRVASRRPQFPEEIMRVVMMQGIPYSGHDKSVRSMQETAAILLEWWINYCSSEYRIIKEARLAVTEALVKGRGLLWHGYQETPDGLMPVSFYESVDNLFIDDEAVTLRDAGYIIRKRRMSSWRAADMLGIPEAKLIAIAKPSEIEEQPEDARIVEFYEVYSRIGIGAQFAGPDSDLGKLRDVFESVGQYVYLVISESCDYPLNLDPEIIEGDPSRAAVALDWPIASYGDTMNPWPASFLDFFPETTNPWARSPLSPGLPMQVFLDHLYGYIFSQAKRSMKTIVVVPDYVDQSFVQSLAEQDSDYDVVMINRQQVDDLAKELYHVIRLPEINPEVWQLVQLAERAFERAVGLDPMLYGAQPDRQIRSAAEANLRFQTASSRAQHFADEVEKWLSDVSSKDGLVTRLYKPWNEMFRFFNENEQAVALGPEMWREAPLTALWAGYISTDDPVQAASDYWFSIETGSGVRKDKQQQAQAAQMIAQTLLPIAMEMAAKTGNFEMYNRIVERLSNALDLDAGLFRVEGVPSYGQAMDSEGNSETGVPDRAGKEGGRNGRAVLQQEA